MVIVLLGYMGSGKSVVGKMLSKALDCPFIDLDDYIENQEKKPVVSIFETSGEIHFRKLESKYLQEVLHHHSKAVLSLGGGTPCYGAIMNDLLNNEQVVTTYLNASVETLTNRLWMEKDARPLISHLSSEEALNEFIRKHLFERGFFYNQAEIKILVDTLTEAEIVTKILLELF